MTLKLFSSQSATIATEAIYPRLINLGKQVRGTDKVHILAAFAVMRRKWFHFWRKCCDDYGWGFKLLFGGNVIMYSKGCGEILRKAWRTWKGGGCLIASSWQTCHKQQQTAREEIKTLEMSCKKWNEPVQYWCFLPHDSLLKCNMHVSIFTIWCLYGMHAPRGLFHRVARTIQLF